MSGSTRLISVLCAAAALGGCGVGPGDSPEGGVQLTATRDFGDRTVLARPQAKVQGADTVMRVLDRNATVTKRFGGDFVQSIDGIEGGRSGGRPVDWFIYVNGIQSEKGANAVEVHGGDRLWWDHHDWAVTPDIPAVVGSFPEPFVHGTDGKRLPVRVECEDPRAGACDVVAKKLIALGVPAGRSTLSHSAADDSLRVLVGEWKRLRGGDPESDAIDSGPRASGVFARFDTTGTKLAVLDPRGRTARTLGAGTGLIAATQEPDRKPVWFVTGTDDAGVDSAARAFDESTLHDRFALAIADDLPVSVPLLGAAAP
ncbi:MAG TPA: DUF4430 domain-containing protein [Solirubrobacteraceae bacterium]|nr:DUF4430 domain-containing protein [Solirubrobacteraceae bacterium]